MNHWTRSLLALLFLCPLDALASAPGMPGLFAPPAAPAAPARRGPARPRLSYASLPLVFEPNRGQTDPKVLYLSRNKGFTLFLTATEAVLRFQGPAPQRPAPPKGALPGRFRGTRLGPSKVLRLRWLGASLNPQSLPSHRLPGHSNYFLGNDPSRWRTDVPQYGAVAFSGLYPGIGLAYRDGGHDTLEFDWLIAAGAKPGAIALRVQGAGSLRLDGHGNVVADLGDGQTFILAAPRANQAGVPVPSSFRLLTPRTVGLNLGNYDRNRPLVVDPSLVYATYWGGAAGGEGTCIAADSAGNAYVAGTVTPPGFPTTGGSLQSAPPGGFICAFVSKISPDGLTPIYSTYLGGAPSPVAGSGIMTTNAIALDAAGDAYIVGSTGSPNFPLVNPLQNSCVSCANGSSPDAYVAKLNSTGSALLYSSYLGGSQGAVAAGVAVDATGAATVVGWTSSTDYPVANAFEPNCGGCVGGAFSAFVTKFSPTGNALIYSTYFGLGTTEAYAVALDASGNAYVAGGGAVPLASPLYSTGNGFASEFKSNGGGLVYSTQVPGCANGVEGVAVDPSGSAYYCGWALSQYGGTSYGIFPLVRALQTQPSAAAITPFAMRLSPGGGSIAYSTYVGGTGINDSICTMATDANGDACVSLGNSSGAPLVNPLAPCLGCAAGGGYPYLEVLSPGGTSILFATYLGGSGTTVGAYGGGVGTVGDVALGIATDASNNIYVTGLTYSTDFPVQNALQATLGSPGYSAFVAKIHWNLPPTATPTGSPTPSFTATSTFTVPPSASATSTVTQTFNASPTPSVSPTRSPSFTASPTLSASPTTTPNLFLIHGLINDCGAFPNPFADRLNLCVALSVPSQVTVTVYDVAGELVDRLTVSEGIGDQDVVWGGVNRFGQRCASGVYLVRVAAVGANGAQGGYWERVAIVR